MSVYFDPFKEYFECVRFKILSLGVDVKDSRNREVVKDMIAQFLPRETEPGWVAKRIDDWYEKIKEPKKRSFWGEGLFGRLRLSLFFAKKPPGESVKAVQSSPLQASRDLTGVAKVVKDKQKDHLGKLQNLARQGAWEHLREHTSHRDSGFDWWMFPIDRDSQGQGSRYTLTPESIAALKRDPEFMKNYRSGVILVTASWGWDLEKNAPCNPLNSSQLWTGYEVRLGKMLHSLTLFGEKDLHGRLVAWFLSKQPNGFQRDTWANHYLREIL